MSNSWIACVGIHSFPPNSVHPNPVFTSNLRNPIPYRRAGSLVLLRTPVGLSILKESQDTRFLTMGWSNRWWCHWSKSQSVDASGPFHLLTGNETDGQQTAFLKQSTWLDWCCSAFGKLVNWRLCKNYITSSTTIDWAFLGACLSSM